jgi:long-chain acyl-CoA synthetase
LTEGVGALVASLIRKVKPDVGGLDPSLNLELDLGLDSLARVELLSEIETELGVRVSDEEATRIYTLGELLDALDGQDRKATKSGPGWKEILAVSPEDPLNQHYIFKPKPVATAIIVSLSRILNVLTRTVTRLNARGLENLPESGPLMLCPNHESYLDAPMLYATLPARLIGRIFSLGYSDYWTGAISRRIAEACNIVAIDPNVNLVRAMQAGAVGLKRNKVLLIFPEGTRTIDGRLSSFKKGAAILAFELGVPIVPVGINGTFETWPRNGGFALHPIEIVFGKPIDPRHFACAADPYGELTDHLRDAVDKLTN